jgi:hypothetical protein
VENPPEYGLFGLTLPRDHATRYRSREAWWDILREEYRALRRNGPRRKFQAKKRPGFPDLFKALSVVA